MTTENIAISHEGPVNIQMDVPLDREQRAAEFRKELDAIRNEQPQEETTTEVENAQRIENSDSDSTIHDGARDESSSDLTLGAEHDDGSSTDSDIKNPFIPRKTLDKERAKRREAEQKLQEERDARIKYETEANLYNQAMQKLNRTQEQQHEPELDPLDNDAHNYYMRKIQELEQKIDQRTDTLNQTHQQNRFETVVNNQSAEFSKQHSDFNDAYKFMIDREKDNARLLGIGEDQLDTAVMQKLQPMAWTIYNNGGNVAESVYKMAKNYGYNAKAPQKPSGVNLKAIEKNMAKTTSIIDDVPASSTGLKNNAAAFVKMDRFAEGMMNEGGAGVDKNKFRKLLDQIAAG